MIPEILDLRMGEDTPLLNRLLDPEDKDPITLSGAETEYLFSQCATIPYRHTLYAVLHPITRVEGLDEDMCIVFRYVQNDEYESLIAEEDEETARTVYKMYLELVEGGQ